MKRGGAVSPLFIAASHSRVLTREAQQSAFRAVDSIKPCLSQRTDQFSETGAKGDTFDPPSDLPLGNELRGARAAGIFKLTHGDSFILNRIVSERGAAAQTHSHQR